MDPIKISDTIGFCPTRSWGLGSIHFRFSDDTGARVGAAVALYDLFNLRSIGI